MPSWRGFRRFFRIVLFIMLSILITDIAQAESNQYGSVAWGVNNLLAHAGRTVRVGVFVQSMDTGRVYFSKNANQLFAPASTQKLFTVASALMTLGPQYHFPTRLLTDGRITQGVLNGDLVFQFSGDPSLKSKTLKNFVETLRTMGIHRINGNIIIDDTAFNHIPYPPGWTWHDLSFDFAAPLNTVIINRNQFGLSFVPRRAGERPALIPHFPPNSATFINQAITTNYPKRNCPVTIFSNENNQYLIRGCFARRSGRQGRSLAIRNLQMFTKGLIFELLRKNNIHFYSRVYYAKTPQNATVLTEHFSKPLGQLIIHLLKRSDNLYADALLKKLGERYSHQQGSWQNGIAAIKSILQNNIGMTLSAVHLHDGSGLSQYNSVTPRSMGELLHYIYRNNMLKNTLIPALPIAGVDGTLAWRMPDMARHKRLYAKTGSMTGVSSLAGFIRTRYHGVLSFVIMINDVPKNRAPSILLENRICEWLLRAQ